MQTVVINILIRNFNKAGCLITQFTGIQLHQEIGSDHEETAF